MANFGTPRAQRAAGRVKAVVGVSLGMSLAAQSALAYGAPVNPSQEVLNQANNAVSLAERSVTDLVGKVSQAESELQDLERAIGQQREAANKALVDLHDAQTQAELARRGVTRARAELDELQRKIEEAQKVLNEISNTTYRTGGSSAVSAAGSRNAEDALARQSYLRTSAAEQRAVIDDLDELRTAKANEESRLRKTAEAAEERESAAEQAQQDAETQIQQSQEAIDAKLAERASIISDQENAQSALDAARGNASELADQRKEYEEYQQAESQRQQAEAEQAAAEAAAAQAKQQAEDAQRKQEQATESEQSTATAEASAAQDAADQAQQAADTARQAASAATQNAQTAAAALVAASQPDHTSTDNPYDDDDEDSDLLALQNENAAGTDSNSDLNLTNVSTASQVSEQASSTVSGTAAQQIETVIARAKSQLGVPYVWGGGNANGPTRGIRDGGSGDSYGDYGQVGFDCSGLVLYAFAAVGISLPHYTGYQYQRGTKIDPQKMQRGDLIFWGPNAEQHVAIYLGDGKMIEAPYSGAVVRITDVRWSGMSPYAVRLIS